MTFEIVVLFIYSYIESDYFENLEWLQITNKLTSLHDFFNLIFGDLALTIMKKFKATSTTILKVLYAELMKSSNAEISPSITGDQSSND